MIELKDYSFAYPGAKKKSLHEISLRVGEGECVLITGKSGCGKSTLSRVINGLCPKFYEGEARGEYLLCGKPAGKISLDEIGLTIGSVFQDPRSQFFAKRVRDEIVLAMENHCLSRAAMRERLIEVSDALGIFDLHGRDMRSLSSGEKQKVAIASVCALEPKGLVLDEPSANLDTNATAQLAGFLSRLKAQGHALVISEHRLHYLRDIFDRLIVLGEGKIIAEYSRAEALALPEEQLSGLGLRSFDLPAFGLGGRVSEDSNALRAQKISLRLEDTQILRDVSLGIYPQKITALTGSNGAGKTSLCRILTGIQRETTGMVHIGGAPTRRRARTRNAFFVQQDVDYQLYTPSVEEEISMASAFSRRDPRFAQVVEMLGLEGLLARHPNTLSGGQKQRVLIAAAVLRNAPAMVLDEPTSGLDGHHMRAVSSILRGIAEGARNILLITHDLEFIASAADSLAYMHRAGIQYHKDIARA